MKEYNRARVYLDENYRSQEHFTVSARAPRECCRRAVFSCPGEPAACIAGSLWAQPGSRCLGQPRCGVSLHTAGGRLLRGWPQGERQRLPWDWESLVPPLRESLVWAAGDTWKAAPARRTAAGAGAASWRSRRRPGCEWLAAGPEDRRPTCPGRRGAPQPPCELSFLCFPCPPRVPRHLRPVVPPAQVPVCRPPP